jgi:hypothetical protein
MAYSGISGQLLPPKALIGVLHIRTNSGIPFSRSSIEKITTELIDEALQLQHFGFNGLILEYHVNRPTSFGMSVSEQLAAMTAIAIAIRDAVPCPLGIQFLGGANKETLAIAIAANAQFIRVKGFDSISGAASLLNYRKNIEGECVALFADIFEKSDASFMTIAENVLSFGANGVIISSPDDSSIDRELLRNIHSHHKCPLWIGSGVNSENLMGLWPFADAFIIDTFIRDKTTMQLDPERLKRLASTLDHLKHSIA